MHLPDRVGRQLERTLNALSSLIFAVLSAGVAVCLLEDLRMIRSLAAI